MIRSMLNSGFAKYSSLGALKPDFRQIRSGALGIPLFSRSLEALPPSIRNMTNIKLPAADIPIAVPSGLSEDILQDFPPLNV
jgi:hypothetical protein